MKAIVVVVALFVAVASAGTCTLSAYDSNSYNANSAKVDDPVSCGWYKDDSCCKASFSTEAARNQFGDIPSGCSDILNIMLCGTCSPSQGTFITGDLKDLFKYKICKKFCSDIYSKCADAKFGGKKVSEYSSSDAFCAAALGNNHTSVYTADGNCFNAASSLVPIAALVLALLALLL